MLIHTSSWREYKGPGRVGVCQSMPRGAPAGFKMYKPLAPTWDIIKGSKTIHEYRPRYFAEILDHLDPNQVVQDLHRLAKGATTVMMCFEVTPLTDSNFCHRTMAGEWLMQHTDVTVRELDPTQADLLRA